MTNAAGPREQLAGAGRLLAPGRNCWRIERAARFAVIVDAADYFSAIKSSILKARRRVFLIGWDFDTRVSLDPGNRESARNPDRLGRFLNAVVKARPELEIYLLKWDLGIVHSFGRGSTPLFILDWITDSRIHMRLDGAHPVGSAHHQKVVVIDDALAFCGGIDITADRWDTREHRDDDDRRRRPTTRRIYPPWHDATTAVDGDIARALGDLARQRWERATGEALPPPDPQGDPWPDGVEPTFTNIDVAIARTVPRHDEQAEVREIEALYLSAIRRARRAIYIESQYFAARRIAEAMAERLGEPDGPEIVVVNPQSAFGWLEEGVMGSARARLLDLVGRADRHGRFRIYTPFTAGGNPIYVHAKVMIVDDWLLRVGSSNLNNRSMGYDTECDLAVEAPAGITGAAVRRTVQALRDDLLAEHLGVTRDAVASALQRGTLIAAIESLHGDGRSLRRFEPPDYGKLGEALAESELLDPERVSSHGAKPLRWARAIKGRLGRFAGLATG